MCVWAGHHEPPPAQAPRAGGGHAHHLHHAHRLHGAYLWKQHRTVMARCELAPSRVCGSSIGHLPGSGRPRSLVSLLRCLLFPCQFACKSKETCLKTADLKAVAKVTTTACTTTPLPAPPGQAAVPPHHCRHHKSIANQLRLPHHPHLPGRCGMEVMTVATCVVVCRAGVAHQERQHRARGAHPRPRCRAPAIPS